MVPHSEHDRRPERPPVRRVAALDLGKVRVGVALSDELRMFAHPRPSLSGRDRGQLLGALKKLVDEYDIERVLVGYPLKLSGDRGAAASRAARFAEQLAGRAGVDVELVDERLSTVQAQQQLLASGRTKKRMRAQVDSVAAALILQQWLDATRPTELGND